MASYGGSTGQKEFISADILTRNVGVNLEDYSVFGDGLFDELMETATKHLQMQFEANRIRQEDYANAYIDIYKATLQAALQAWATKLNDSENEAKIRLLEAQALAEQAKIALYKRQAEGFDENYKEKILKIMCDTWAVGFSVAKDSFEASGIPAVMTKAALDDFYNTYIRADYDNRDWGND